MSSRQLFEKMDEWEQSEQSAETWGSFPSYQVQSCRIPLTLSQPKYLLVTMVPPIGSSIPTRSRNGVTSPRCRPNDEALP